LGLCLFAVVGAERMDVIEFCTSSVVETGGPLFVIDQHQTEISKHAKITMPTNQNVIKNALNPPNAVSFHITEILSKVSVGNFVHCQENHHLVHFFNSISSYKQ
jgi:hypothetical protein